jgi:hypothetical protein
LAMLAIVASALGIGMTSSDALVQVDQRLIGTWEWVSVDNFNADGMKTQPFGPKPGGYVNHCSSRRSP